MSGTASLRRELKKHSIRANGLITLMANDQDSAPKQSESEGQNRRAREKNPVGIADQSP